MPHAMPPEPAPRAPDPRAISELTSTLCPSRPRKTRSSHPRPQNVLSVTPTHPSPSLISSTTSPSSPLDHTAYPHILDRVLALSGPSSLLPFRPTCRALCAQIDARLYARLTFTRTDTTTYIHTPTALRPVERTDVVETAGTVGGLAAGLQDARLSHTQVLDAWGGKVPLDLLHALPSLRLLRTSVSAPLAPVHRGRPGTPSGGALQGNGDHADQGRLPRPVTLVRFFSIHDRHATFAWSAFGAPRTVFVIRFNPAYPGLLRHDVFDEARLRSLDCSRFYFLLSPTAKDGAEILDALSARDDPGHLAHHSMLAEGGVLNVLARGVSEWRDHWRRNSRTGKPRQTFTFVGWEGWETAWLKDTFRRWRDSVPLHEGEGGGGWWEEDVVESDGAPDSVESDGAGDGRGMSDRGEPGAATTWSSTEVGQKLKSDIRARFLRWVLFDTDDWGDEVRGVLRDSVEFMTLEEFRAEVDDPMLFPLITAM